SQQRLVRTELAVGVRLHLPEGTILRLVAEEMRLVLGCSRVLVRLVRRRAQSYRLDEGLRHGRELVVHLDAEDLLELGRALRTLHLVALEVIDRRVGQRPRSRLLEGLQRRHQQDVRPHDVELDRAELVHHGQIRHLHVGGGHQVADQVIGMQWSGRVLAILVRWRTQAVREPDGLAVLAELVLHRNAGDDRERLRLDLVALVVDWKAVARRRGARAHARTPRRGWAGCDEPGNEVYVRWHALPDLLAKPGWVVRHIERTAGIVPP